MVAVIIMLKDAKKEISELKQMIETHRNFAEGLNNRAMEQVFIKFLSVARMVEYRLIDAVGIMTEQHQKKGD